MPLLSQDQIAHMLRLYRLSPTAYRLSEGAEDPHDLRIVPPLRPDEDDGTPLAEPDMAEPDVDEDEGDEGDDADGPVARDRAALPF